MVTSKFTTVDEYISAMPPDFRKKLKEMRGLIQKAAPEAQETITYNMPAYKWQGVLVYFAACKNHIGFYPLPSAISAFKKEISVFESSKGAVQFPIDEPLPAALITKMVKFRVKENKLKV